MKVTKNIFKALLIVILLLTITIPLKAQLTPFQAMYFQNPYLYNPAMAGMAKELDINTGYRQQWSGIPGTPKTTIFTADYQPIDRVGVGLNVSDDQAGLIRQTRIMGTYAYHLQVGEGNQRLNFGLSLGVNDSRVNYAKVNGDITDTEIALYNQLKPYVDGDFGLSYTDNSLYIGSVLPNLKSTFSGTSDTRFDADQLVFIGIASYKLPLQSESRSFVLEPLVGYRVIKGYNNIIDGGFNFTMTNYGLYIQAIYHSSQSLGLGVGLDQNTYILNFAYNLETGSLGVYTPGAFELSIKLRLFENNKKD